MSILLYPGHDVHELLHDLAEGRCSGTIWVDLQEALALLTCPHHLRIQRQSAEIGYIELLAHAEGRGEGSRGGDT